MGFVGDFIGGIFGGNDAADATRAASDAAAYQQQQALNYLKESDAIPRQFREGALGILGGLYGLEGGEGSQQALIDQAKESPLYSAIMGTQEAGENAIMRNAAATGGLRGGNTQGALTDYGSQLANQALLTSYQDQLSGLQGLAGLPSNANQIASTMAGIGQTQAAGIQGAAQARQQALGTGINTILGGIGLFI